MSTITVRRATRADLAQITSIYNHYVLNTPVTFDIEPLTPQQREEWFDAHTQGTGTSTFHCRRWQTHCRLCGNRQIPQQSRVRHDGRGDGLLRAGCNSTRDWRDAVPAIVRIAAQRGYPPFGGGNHNPQPS